MKNMETPMVIAVAHLKGGAGKTTVSLAIATTLHQEGYRVLIIDTDPQQTASRWAAVGAEHDHDMPPVVHVQPGTVQRAVKHHTSNYDVIVIDTPPQLARETRAAMLAAGDFNGMVLIPVSVGAGDRWALDDTLEVANSAQALRPDLKVITVRNNFRERTIAAQIIVESMREANIPMLDTVLGHRTAFVEAQMTGNGVTQHAPRSTAAREARTLTSEVMQQW